MDAGFLVGAIHDVADGALVDARLALIRSKHDRRLVERLALDHVVAAGERLAHAPHVHARKDHLRSRRSDVDADGNELQVVLLPQRVVLEVVVAEVVVVVIVVVVALRVDVQAALAHQVVGERMLLLSDGLGHQILKLSRVSGAKSSSGFRSVFDSPCSWW
jgi:hypothetical protein